MAPLLDAVDLETIPLFRGLTPTEQRHLHDLLGVRTFPAGVDILTAEQPGDVAYIVLDGTVKVQVDPPGWNGSHPRHSARRRDCGRDEPHRPSWPLCHGRGDGTNHSRLVNSHRLLELPAVHADDDIQPRRHSFPAAAPFERARRSPGDAGHRTSTCRSTPRSVRGVRRSNIKRWLPDPFSFDSRRFGGVGRGFTGARQSDPGQLEAQRSAERRRAACRHPPRSTRIGRDGARPPRRVASARSVKQLAAMAIKLT